VFVSCDNCHAEYELDDAKIPAGGARLRCSGCDHSFVITPPEAGDLQSADDLARDALSPEVSDEVAPGSEQEASPKAEFDLDSDGFDLGGEDLDLDADDSDSDGGDFESDGEDFAAGGDVLTADGGDFALDSDEFSGGELTDSEDDGSTSDGGDLASDREGSASEGDGLSSDGEDFDPDGESDWEFNDEIDTPESRSEEPASDSDFDRDEDWNNHATAEDVVDGLLGSDGAVDADADAAAAVDADAAVDDLLGEIDTAAAQLGEPGGDLRSEEEPPGEGLGEPDVVDETGVDPAADGDALEDLSDWDLFDQPAESDASSVSAGTNQQPASAARDGVRAEPQVGLTVEMADDVLPTVRWTDRVSEIAGWGAVLSMLVVALVGGLASNSSDGRAPAGSWSGAGFEADQIAGRWVDNAVAGSIYVVSGRIRGASGSDRTPPTTLGIRLFDTAGREIDRAPIPLAPAIPERILRESSPAELDAFQAGRADRVAAAGTSWISFEAVLTDLPRFAGRFELQALDR
jgi:predicted Zn finger-like uncharacterized protein